MASMIKSCDLPGGPAAKLFELLNPGEVEAKIASDDPCDYIQCYEIVTDIEPSALTYPEGWYYAKGNFRNKHNSTTGRYYEIHMVKSNGEPWKETAKYCTADQAN